MKTIIRSLFGLLLAGVTMADEGPFVFEFEELADGVWTGVREDGHRFPVMGNTTFVVTDEGVVVFDGGGMPAMSEQIIEKVRAMTHKPVTHVVISHWHGDHSFGVFRFAEEFPNVQFIAHQFTRDIINSSRINYIDRESGFVESNLEEFTRIVETGIDSEGEEQSETDRAIYARILKDGDVIDHEFLRAKVTPPDIVFTDNYTIESGGRNIELLYLGHGNTAGDIVMWLPDERIVATGDIVVLPSPYAFNMPPRPWAETLRAISALDYKVLVPGHGAVQYDTDYVDLVIEVADSIADQRDDLLEQGLEGEALEAALDFSAFEQRFTRGDEYVRVHYEQWFELPFRKAAVKALTGEPMVQIEPPISVAFDDEQWKIEASEYELVEHLGEPALKIRGGAALLPDLDLPNAMVEFDVAVGEDRGFVGLIFRMQDEENFENFYIRPHQSGNPDANQYQPMFNGSASWQLYHGPEYAVPVEYRYNEWMKVKVVYARDQAEVYIDSDEPVLRIGELKHDSERGAIGVSTGNFAPAHFANFRYTKLANAYQFPAMHKEVLPVMGTVSTWQVSDTFDQVVLTDTLMLTDAHTSERSWTTLNAEPTGITNLAQVARPGPGTDTVFARLIVDSDEARQKELAFGYSDKAQVFVNGKLVYKGDNTYRSRDYRYLGTIGLFDTVVLPLGAGRNEVWIAITEAFGGWGIQARFSDLEGIRISP
jgi:glyoxylase-like metal-dependent hydrolase (beta-lactamase superfamily II)